MQSVTKFIYIILCVVSLGGCAELVIDDDHSHTPHDGVLAPFSDADNLVGYVELKLHDDKGDLELWLTDPRDNKAFDIPLDSKIKVTFPDMNNKEVWLKVRNKVNNEDEYGQANIHNGKTNYFIFPGDTGQSAKFLVGSDFSAKVIVSFMVDKKLYKTDAFMLMPHVH